MELELWIEEYLANGEWRPSTRIAYTRALGAWKPVLGDVPVGDIRPVEVQTALTAWKRAGVGARTLQQRWQYLHSCLEVAYRLEIIDRNPVSRVPKPKTKEKKGVRWDLDQVKAFIRACESSGQDHSHLILFLLLTGLRLSEALALTWEDIEGKTVRIDKALVWSDGGYSLQEPKSESGTRSITLNSAARALIESRLHDKGRIFTTESGKPPRKDTLSRLMTDLCLAAGVPRARVHDLRHVHAALLVRGGLDIKSLQSVLGHSRSSMSLDVYAYAFPGNEGAARALDLVLTS